MDGAPVRKTADCKAVSAGAVELMQSLCIFKKLLGCLRNRKTLLFKNLLIIGQDIYFPAHGKCPLGTGSYRMSGYAVPFQSIDNGRDEIIILPFGRCQIRVDEILKRFKVACCRIFP